VQIRLNRSVDGASLAVFRVGLGLTGALLIVRLWSNGWLASLYSDPLNHLRYPGLAWIPEVPSFLVHPVAAVAAIGAIAVVLGWHHRWGAGLFATAFAWLEATEATTYLNHYWLLTYLYVLAVFLPLSAVFAIRSDQNGRLVPFGAIWLLRAQIVLVYFFAGFAKIREDWLVQGLPLRLWLPARADLPLLGSLLEQPVTAVVLSWAGLIFDLFVGVALLSRRLRAWAFAAVVGFHGATWLLFPSIGIFPLAMVVATLVFFDPDWPRHSNPRLWRSNPPTDSVARIELTKPGTRHWFGHRPEPLVETSWGMGATVLSALWLAVQLALPLRQFLTPGDLRLTGESYRFAWNVLASERTGSVTFRITDPADGSTWIDDASGLYTPTQIRLAAVEPDLILQMAHRVAAEWQTPGTSIQVRADAFISINGRPEQRLLNPELNLASVPVGSVSSRILANPDGPDI
jgi:hypothetical protein